MLFASFLVALAVFANAVHATVPEDYACSFCVNIAMNVLQEGDKSATLYDTCRNLFPLKKSVCEQFKQSGSFAFLWDETTPMKADEATARSMCQAKVLCPTTDYFGMAAAANTGGLDVRVSKSLGSRAYNQVRVSVIAPRVLQATLASSSSTTNLFTYTEPFKYKWITTDTEEANILNTGLVTVTPGETTTIDIEGTLVNIHLPAEDSGVRGIIIGDPCFQSNWITCHGVDTLQPFQRLTSLLNAALPKPDMDYYVILGDNFYDLNGTASAQFTGALTTEAKSKFLLTVPGNHDHYVHGSPDLWTVNDQMANGFMQFYGQDVLASKADSSVPFDFSVPPETSDSYPKQENFFFYNKIGNVGFIGYNGVYEFNSSLPLFEEACEWAAEVKPEVVLLLGHWTASGDGCPDGSTVPDVYTQLSQIPACAAMSPTMKFFVGHTHCNSESDFSVNNDGFLVGAAGMYSNSLCTPMFGFSVVDTTANQVVVWYFPVQQLAAMATKAFDNWEAIYNCIAANGVSGCYQYATKWSFQPLPLSG